VVGKPEVIQGGTERISNDKSACVYECVRSCPYTVSLECHLTKTGHSTHNPKPGTPVPDYLRYGDITPVTELSVAGQITLGMYEGRV
jgi:hypothetical protein